jgi:transposase InsO family protein
VARERRDSGKVTSGWRTVRDAQPELPVRLVQASVAALKARGRRRAAGHRTATRTTLHVLSRDVLGSEDASELGRCAEARVHGEAVKDVASLRTLQPTVVPRAPCAHDTIAKLQALERQGRLPLVLATDYGGPYVASEVERWLAEHEVVHLLNLPHTPQHNAWIERAFRELEAEAGLGAGLVLDSLDEALVRLLDARRRLEEHRPRACLGGRTAADVDRMLPSWEAAVDRGAFYAAACQARDEALRDVIGARARRRAAREATLSTLERFGLAYRPRGGARLPTGKAEGISCPLQ